MKEIQIDNEILNIKDIIRYFAYSCNGDWDEIMTAIKNKQECSPNDVKRIQNQIGDSITVLDEKYPNTLKNSNRPPFVLFYRGNLELIQDSSNTLTVLNDHLASNYATETIEKICIELAKDLIFVMPFGYKKSNCLIRKLIDKGAKVVAVLDKGIDTYNDDNKELFEELCENHLVISEYPKTVLNKTQKTEFHAAKLMASLSSNTLVGGTTKRSSQNVGLSIAIANNANIMCIPFNAGSNYEANSLIKMGAFMVEDYKDVIEVLELDKRGIRNGK